MTKLSTGIGYHESSPTTEYYVKRSKVKVTGSQSAEICEFVCLSARYLKNE